MSVLDDSLNPFRLGSANQPEANRGGSVDNLGIRWEGSVVESNVLTVVPERGPELVYVVVEKGRRILATDKHR